MLAHEVDHLVERLRRRLDDHVDALAEDVELEVGDQRRDLDQRVGAEVEAGHLAVDPHQSVVHERSPYPSACPPALSGVDSGVDLLTFGV